MPDFFKFYEIESLPSHKKTKYSVYTYMTF